MLSYRPPVPLVPVYSIAKTFTAAGVLAANIDIDRTVGEFLDTPAHYRPLPIRALLQHVSGLGDYFDLPEYRSAVEGREAAWSDLELLERALIAPPSTPGRFRYSNVGYTLVRMVLEEVADAEFHTALSQLVFEPLQIHDVYPLRERSDWGRCEEATESVRGYDPRWVFPRTFLATPDVVAHGLCAILRGELFDPSQLFDSVRVDAPGHSFEDPCYGLGVMIDGSRFIGHGGGGPGFELFALAKPDGSAAHLEYRVTENDLGDADLIAAGVECLRAQGSR